MDFLALISFHLHYKKFINTNKNDKDLKDGVTVVVTSCGRPNHLEGMLLSFIKFNTYPIDEMIIIEDAGCKDSINVAKKIVSKNILRIICNNKNIGQMASIDRAYSSVKTKYIFHIEEDWIFLKPNFIEKSLRVIEKNPQLACISLRPHKDWKKYSYVRVDHEYFIINKVRNFIWNGICINPGIYKTNNYFKIGKYTLLKKERQVIQAYRHIGLKGGLLSDELGYVYHSGEAATTRKNYKVA